MPFNVQLYLLQLQQDKFYVGQSDRTIIRYHEHLIGQGSKWTRQYPAIALLKIKTINVLHADEANLYENWMTLHYMEKYGWENVRGGRFLDLEQYRIKDKLKYIYDTERNHIRYHVTNTPYLFGECPNWLIYILEYPDKRYYIGSCKWLGESLGKHFRKAIPPVCVKQLIEVTPQQGHYLDIKRNLFHQYRDQYGPAKVSGAQLPDKSC